MQAISPLYRHLFVFLLLLVSACGLAAAQEAPDALIRRVSQEVMDIARNDPAIQAGDRRRIHAVVEAKILPHLDFQRGTALTMGRNWREATPEQRERLSAEFRNLLLYTYAGAMSQIKDQTMTFRPLRMEPSDTNVEVRSEVRLPRRPEPVEVSYRLRKTASGWKIYDVNVMGAWLSETYRTTFASEISRGGIDGLIRTLEEKNRQLATRDARENGKP
ncbi:MAG: ABC transporter substrate-binding protein [Proteobacteria bacterium]|nr:MAG: ABC transporter substrate-binding protein [Pseudomonadota bacterium]